MIQLMPHAGLPATVDRYLEALECASRSVLRRERANCKSLHQFLTRRGALRLNRVLVVEWVSAVPDARPEHREKRIETLRRLIALTPGYDDLSSWIDSSRGRLLSTRRVLPLIAQHLSPSQGPRTVAARYAAGAASMLSSGRQRRAYYLARRALREDPACIEAHAVIGRLDLEAGRTARALRRFREALIMCADGRPRQLDLGVAKVLDGLGQTLLAVDCPDEAANVYRRLRRANPTWATHSHRILARIALMAGRPNDAAQWLEALSGVETIGLVLCWSLADRHDRAASKYAQSLATNPLVPPLLLGRHDDPALVMLARRTSMLESAERYVADWHDVWELEPRALVHLASLWEHPASRRLVLRVANTPERVDGLPIRRAAAALSSL
ncbi:MAG: tetratricopeptide (TPR) repeat protein [Myxococcota bacterium]|jgi:tetratricopeptide (TPR) repeat protein